MEIAMLGDSYTFGPAQDLGSSYSFGHATMGNDFIDNAKDIIETIGDEIEDIVDSSGNTTSDPISPDQAPAEPSFFEKNKPLLVVGGAIAALIYFTKAK